jgi:hypothetical protein
MLRSLDGVDLATGDQTQAIANDRTLSRTSGLQGRIAHDETTCSHSGHVQGRLRPSDQKAFPTPLDADRPGRSEVVTKYRRHGQDRHPAHDVAGRSRERIIPTLLKNVRPEDGRS